MLPKWAFSLILFAVAVLGAMMAKLAQRRGGKAMMLAEAFVSGGLINAALVHLLAENMETLEEASAVSEISESGEEEAYHWAPLLCGIGALLTHTVEACAEPLLERLHAEKRPAIDGEVVGHKAPEMRNVVSTNSPSDEENQSQLPDQLSKKGEAHLSLTGPLLLLALTFHSVLEGLSLGAAQDQDVLDIFFPILAHKGMAAFTLGINWNGLRGYCAALCFFAILTPLGILIGQTAEGSTASVLLSISAGTFLYIGLVETMPGVRQPWLPTIMGRMAQMSACVAGFAAMSTLAIWT